MSEIKEKDIKLSKNLAAYCRKHKGLTKLLKEAIVAYGEVFEPYVISNLDSINSFAWSISSMGIDFWVNHQVRYISWLEKRNRPKTK